MRVKLVGVAFGGCDGHKRPCSVTRVERRVQDGGAGAARAFLQARHGAFVDLLARLGYFTSGYLNLLGTSLEQFVQREGRMLLGLPCTFPATFEAIEDGLSMEEAVEKEVLRLVQNFSAPTPGVDVLTALLRLGRLEIQIAQRSNGGLYHEKLGVFFEEPCEDPHEAVRGTDFATAAGSDFVTFLGRRTKPRLGTSNYESIDVYTVGHRGAGREKRRPISEPVDRPSERNQNLRFPAAARCLNARPARHLRSGRDAT